MPSAGLIVLDAPDPQAILFPARLLQESLESHAVLAGAQESAAWEIVAGAAAPAEQVRVVLHVVPGSLSHPQGYRLSITPEAIRVFAPQPAGIFYAVQTLRQLLRWRPPQELSGAEAGGLQPAVQAAEVALPGMRCTDWPDFPHRGVLLDISRDRVPTMETLYDLVDLLASWKINQLQLYTEHSFAYRNHPEVWAEASPLTGQEILTLDAYCRERFIELVPNQNTFGHMYRWLRHPHYLPLAEAPQGAQSPWGFYWEGPYSLSPVNPGSLDLVRDLLDELLPNFSSRQVNVGCDETFDVGQGASKELAAEVGRSQIYLDFVLKIYREVKARGRTMQLWGDIIMEHPQLAPQLPGDVTVLEWGYEGDHPFAEHGAVFAASGVPFYVCPGTSSWRSVAGRTDNALANLRNAAENGLQHGAIGYLVTDWGDQGHWQPLPVSYVGFVAGAAFSWCHAANAGLDVPAALDALAFQDRGEVMGRLAYDLGNVYQAPGVLLPNASVLFSALQATPEEMRQSLTRSEEGAALPARLRATLERIDQITAPLCREPGAPALKSRTVDMQRPDAALIEREFGWVAGMLRHACWRLLWILGDGDKADQAAADWLAADAGRLIAEYHDLWHARSRPGGFQDSVARIERMRSHYLGGGQG